MLAATTIGGFATGSAELRIAPEVLRQLTSIYRSVEEGRRARGSQEQVPTDEHDELT